MGKKGNTEDEIRAAVNQSLSLRGTLIALGLVPAGGNYIHLKMRIKKFDIDTSHFTGKGWNIGARFRPVTPKVPLNIILTKGRFHQSYGLKLRLVNAGLKKLSCEICGWAEKSEDGRIPVELDHINGDHLDNRLINLRILCPNCHSLQLTHRGKNKRPMPE